MDRIIGVYVAVAAGRGCGYNHDVGYDVATITEGECKRAAASLGFDSSKGYEKLNYGHLPHGCFFGHKHTNWKYTYYNVNTGKTNPGFKSICRNGTISFRLRL